MKPSRYSEEMIRQYQEKGYWDLPTLSEQCDRNAKHHPDREALTDSRVRLTFAQEKLWMDRLALALVETGIDRDDIVAILLPNYVEHYLLRLACEKAGVLSLPIRRSIGIADAEYILKKSGATGIAIPWKYRNRDYFAEITGIQSNLPKLRNIYVVADEAPSGAIPLRQMLEQKLEAKYPPEFLENRRFKKTEVAHLFMTTGTTGLPKITQYLAVNRPVLGQAIVKIYSVQANDIISLISPAYLGPNAPAYLAAPLTAAKVAMLEDFEPEAALKLVEKERITLLGGSPALLIQMARHPNFDKYDYSSLRLIDSTAAPLQFAVGQEIEAKFGVPVCNRYGMMDSGLSFGNNPNDSQQIRLGTVGKTIGWAQVKILDEQGKPVPVGQEGEVDMTGPGACDGYLNDPEVTKATWTEDGWIKTGDRGKLDEDGHVTLVGRSKDTIVRGGDNIIPGEVESEVITHPAISSVAIVGMPDLIMGQRACAFVTLHPGMNLALEEMVSFLKKKGITPYKIPERLETIEAMPLVGGEKIDRKALVKQITERLKAEGAELPA